MSPVSGGHVSGAAEVKRMVGKIEAAISGGSAELAPVWTEIGVYCMSILYEAFERQGSASKRWDRLSVVAKVLRKKPTRKYRTIEEAESDDSKKALVDTNRLWHSFQKGRVGSVFQVQRTAVEVGTSYLHAKMLHKGGSSVFTFGPEQEARLEQNFQKAFSGSPAAGREKNWNRDFFVMRGRLRKMSGKTYKTPARPFVDNPLPQTNVARIETLYVQGLANVIRSWGATVTVT